MRYGYRRIHVLLRGEGWLVNAKRVYRLYDRPANKTPKRRVKAKLRDDRRPATRSNETWAMAFVHNQLAAGWKLRVLTIVDTFSRFSPAVGPRFNFRDLDRTSAVSLDFSRPEKPSGNAFIESFNGNFRAECLNGHWFTSLDDARRKCETWRRDYNEGETSQRDRQQKPD